MFPLGHMLFLLNFALCQQMHAARTALSDVVNGPHHVAFVQRNSGYDTFYEKNKTKQTKQHVYQSQFSDLKTALKELNILSLVGREALEQELHNICTS